MQSQLIAGRYQVLRAIGRGGMGTVWLCRDEILGREVAVKQIGALPGESATETKRAMREARSAAALNHPNAVAVYDVVDHDGRPWLVMEYVEGQTLADEISRDGHLSPQRVADIGAQLAAALARAHERGIVHRDIKPGNVLIDKAGRPKISDFGIARGHGDEQLTQVGFITGTPGYLSPELARGGDPASHSDVWALGATLYAAVEGQPPYESRSNPIAMLRAIATERPRPMTHAGPLGPAIDAMMHEDPASRWDMATSARRLGGIARITTVFPRVDPDGTAVMPLAGAPTTPVAPRTPVVAAWTHEPTRNLEPTQNVEPNQPSDASATVLAPPLVEEPAGDATVLAEPVAEEPAGDATVLAEPVAEKPAGDATILAKPAAKKPVTESTVLAPPVAEKPAVAAAVLAKPVVKKPVVAAAAPAKPVVPRPVAAPAVTEADEIDLPEPRRSPDVSGRPPAAVSHDRRPGGRRLALVLVALLVTVLGVAYLINPLGDHSATLAGTANGTTPAGISASTTTPSATIPVAVPPTALATATPTVAAPPTTPAPSATPTVPVRPADTSQKLQSFVFSYYAQVVQDPASTWNSFTPRMRQAAHGKAGYYGFWRTISHVSVHRVRVNPGNRQAVVNLTYTRNDGSTSTENKQFTFVLGDGGYLIDSERQFR